MDRLGDVQILWTIVIIEMKVNDATDDDGCQYDIVVYTNQYLHIYYVLL